MKNYKKLLRRYEEKKHASKQIKMTDMPRYNPYQIGHGVMKSAKYPDRCKRKIQERRMINNWFCEAA